MSLGSLALLQALWATTSTHSTWAGRWVSVLFWVPLLLLGAAFVVPVCESNRLFPHDLTAYLPICLFAYVPMCLCAYVPTYVFRWPAAHSGPLAYSLKLPDLHHLWLHYC